MKFRDMNLEVKTEETTVTFDGGLDLTVRNYLPIDDKVKLVTYVVERAIDESVGYSSPVRTEVYFALGLCHWYAGIELDEEELPGITYDKLETNGIINGIVNAIPEDEYNFMYELVEATIKNVETFNSSAAGIISAMSNKSSGLDSQITEILEKVKAGEGLEMLSAIKDVVGNS